MAPLTWVIGEGGLLGSGVALAASRSGELWRAPYAISWSAPCGAGDELGSLARVFLRDAGDGPWSVLWCAGSGTIATPREVLAVELVALRATLSALGTATGAERGAFFFASSAGGVYAGVGAPPYDEFSPVHALSDYGRAKIEAEALVSEWHERFGIPTLIGRIANIYGPGQNINKAQGLISQICRSQLLGRPLSVYVPLDTLRDYLFAPDCAGLIVDAMARLRELDHTTTPGAITKVLASQRAITVGAVIGEMRRIFKNPPRIVSAASLSSSVQVRDLSLISKVWSDLDRRTLTPFPVGVAVTWADLLRRLQGSGLTTLGGAA